MYSLKIVPVCLVLSLLLIGLVQSDSSRASDATGRQKVERMQKGVWGGDHIRLQVTDKGAEIEYDCAHGTIDQPVVVNHAGRFDLKGKHIVESHGPILRDQAPAGRSAHYTGKITGETMTLIVTLTDKSEMVGTFTLTRGSEGNVMKCR